jgi:hypothetical protein
LLPEFGEPTIMPTSARHLEARVVCPGTRQGRRLMGAVSATAEHIAFPPATIRARGSTSVLKAGKTPAFWSATAGWGCANSAWSLSACSADSACPRSRAAVEPLPDILPRRAEARPAHRRSLKPFTSLLDHGFRETSLDLPSFIADTLRARAGRRQRRRSVEPG